jgi:hypothetical protein
MSDNLSNLLANLQGANLAHILEAINSPQPLTITDNARFAPVFNGPFPPRLVFPDENPNLRLLPNGWGGVAVGAWKMVPAPAKDPEEGEYNRMLRLMPMGYRRDLEGDDDGEEYEDEEEEEKGDGDENENENENDDENDDDEDDDEEGDREVFSNGGTPWAPEMEDEEEEEERAYDPEMLLAAETKVC